MNTTDNEYPENAVEKKSEVSKADATAMKSEYVKGATIDSLADNYGYDSTEVEAVVVKDVEPATDNGLQADQPDEQPATKKGK